MRHVYPRILVCISHHPVGHLRCRGVQVKHPLGRNHIGHFLCQVHVAHGQHALLDASARVLPTTVGHSPLRPWIQHILVPRDGGQLLPWHGHRNNGSFCPVALPFKVTEPSGPIVMWGDPLPV